MIEREFINQKTKEFYIREYVKSKLFKIGGISSIKLKKIPLGEKIIITTAKPSLIVGSKGSNIRELTKELKQQFHLENPQIEINEVRNIYLDASIVAEKITGALERFGSARFKSVGHKIMENVMKSGALGIEIVISGKIPSSRAKSWRFYQGYLKKCGDISINGVRKAQASALLKSGIVGVKVAIMPPDLKLPDSIEVLAEPQQIVEEIKEEAKEKKKKDKKTDAAKDAEKKASKKKREAKAKKAEEEKPEPETETAAPNNAQEKTEDNNDESPKITEEREQE